MFCSGTKYFLVFFQCYPFFVFCLISSILSLYRYFLNCTFWYLIVPLHFFNLSTTFHCTCIEQNKKKRKQTKGTDSVEAASHVHRCALVFHEGHSNYMKT